MGKLAAALAWAARGFRVFPLHENTKTPAVDRFQQTASQDPAHIVSWWTDPVTGWERGYNIGVVPNGIVVDLDVKRGVPGIQNFQALGPSLDDTLVVRTPSGGLQLYYAGPPTANSAGRVAPGIDTRGPDGYVIAPGSEIDGRQYELVIDVPIRQIPDEILFRLRAPGQITIDQSPLVEWDLAPALLQAASYMEQLPGATAGAQNNTLFMLGAHLRDLGVSEARAVELVHTHYLGKCWPAVELDTARGILANSYAYAQNAPGAKSPAADFAGVELVPVPAHQVQMELFQPTEYDNPFDAFGNLMELGDLQPRPWIFERFMLRGEVTALVAPGGVGKSQMLLTTAVYLALGWPEMFGLKNRYAGIPSKSMIYDAEDTVEEMSMRLHATCRAMQIDPEQVKPYLVLVSGKGANPFKLKLLTGGNTPTVTDDAKRQMAMIIQTARREGCVMLGVAPLGKLHEVNESDNTAMGRLMDILGGIAERANVGLLIGAHTAKASYAGSAYAGSTNAARGAGDIINGARASFTLSPPTDDDCSHYNLLPEQRRLYLRLDDAKLNRALAGAEPSWIGKQSVLLPSGEEVGAFVPANMRELAKVQYDLLAEHVAGLLGNSYGASMGTTEVAQLLTAADALYGKLSLKALVSRIEMVLAQPVAVEQGHVRLDYIGTKKVVVLGG